MLKNRDIIEHVQESSSNFLSAMQLTSKLLLRGSKKLSAEKIHLSCEIRSDRYAETDLPGIEDLLNSWLKRKKLQTREKSVFCTSRLKVAQDFGEVFIIFPDNSAKYTFSTHVVDIYPKLELWLRDAAIDLASNRSIARECLIDAMGDLSIISIYMERHPSVRKFIADHFLKKLAYQDQEIQDALLAEAEVWFDGTYTAIPYSHPDSQNILDALGLAKPKEKLLQVSR